jgi:hypothetical protein
MTIRRIELSGYWNDSGEVKIQLDTTGKYVIMTVKDAGWLAAIGSYSRVLQELRSVLAESSHEHE